MNKRCKWWCGRVSQLPAAEPLGTPWWSEVPGGPLFCHESAGSDPKVCTVLHGMLLSTSTVTGSPLLPGTECADSNICTTCDTFVCGSCKQLRPSCVGASDEYPDDCDDCVYQKEHPPKPSAEPTLIDDIRAAINKHSAENGSNT